MFPQHIIARIAYDEIQARTESQYNRARYADHAIFTSTSFSFGLRTRISSALRKLANQVEPVRHTAHAR